MLVVEDNEINQMVARELLDRLGLQVSMASSGEDALQILTTSRFDAILMDIKMPGMDGYAATAKIRAGSQFGNSRVPIIAMTAHAMSDDRSKALRAGMDDYISKPVDVTQLTRILLQWLVPSGEPAASLDPGLPAPRFFPISTRPPRLSAWAETWTCTAA